MKLSPEKAIFLFVNNTLPPTGNLIRVRKYQTNNYNHSHHTLADLVSNIYERYKDEDGFLYITYSGENTFGSL